MFTPHVSADDPPLREFIATEEGLEAVLGQPGPRVLAKVVNTLDDICLAFIARSPFVIVASHDAEGRVDVCDRPVSDDRLAAAVEGADGEPSTGDRDLVKRDGHRRPGPASYGGGAA